MGQDLNKRKPENPVVSIIIVVITVVIAVALLSYVNAITKPLRDKYQHEKLMSSLTVACPLKGLTFPSKPDTLKWNGTTWEFFKGRDSGGLVRCVAIITESKKGYGGEIKLLVGVDPEGKIQGIEVLEHYETPGLGDRIKTPEFRNQFKGRSLKDTKFKVKKDGGDIQQLTSATISSRAFCEAVEKALLFFDANKDTILR